MLRNGRRQGRLVVSSSKPFSSSPCSPVCLCWPGWLTSMADPSPPMGREARARVLAKLMRAARSPGRKGKDSKTNK